MTASTVEEVLTVGSRYQDEDDEAQAMEERRQMMRRRRISHRQRRLLLQLRREANNLHAICHAEYRKEGTR